VRRPPGGGDCAIPGLEGAPHRRAGRRFRIGHHRRRGQGSAPGRDRRDGRHAPPLELPAALLAPEGEERLGIDLEGRGEGADVLLAGQRAALVGADALVAHAEVVLGDRFGEHARRPAPLVAGRHERRRKLVGAVPLVGHRAHPLWWTCRRLAE